MTGSLAVRTHVQRKHIGKSVAGKENILFDRGNAGRKVLAARRQASSMENDRAIHRNRHTHDARATCGSHAARVV